VEYITLREYFLLRKGSQMNKENIGHLIRATRQSQNISQTELAQRIGASKSLVCDWEHGRKEPTGSKMIKIIQTLNLNLINITESKEDIPCKN
jgi:DNA-binding transcriptional regulator YiaG